MSLCFYLCMCVFMSLILNWKSEFLVYPCKSLVSESPSWAHPCSITFVLFVFLFLLHLTDSLNTASGHSELVWWLRRAVCCHDNDGGHKVQALEEKTTNITKHHHNQLQTPQMAPSLFHILACFVFLPSHMKTCSCPCVAAVFWTVFAMIEKQTFH